MAGRLIKWVFAFLLFAFLWGVTTSLTMAQERFLIEGILDTEVYETDTGSKFLARNQGDPASILRLQLWSAFQISSKFQIHALGEFDFDDSSGQRETTKRIEQFSLRYSANSSPYYYIEAGKFSSPFGAFYQRYLSTLNPLIGQPDLYDLSYTWGIQVVGSAGWFDYRAAGVDQPVINPENLSYYSSAAFHPVLGLGVTPFAGLRFGASYTRGPYLTSHLESYLPPGTGWRDFDQRLLGFDVQFSRGYLEFNGEVVFSEYDVPFLSKTNDTTSSYLELKYTWTPRFYGVVRLAKNEDVVIRWIGGLSWLSQTRKFKDVEVGFGYRFSANTLLKVAYRRDNWDVDNARKSFFPNGHSLALQLSHHFDLKSWFVKKH